MIDAHLHFRPGEGYFDTIAKAAGHENSAIHLAKEYERLSIACGIVMGNHGLELSNHQYPPFLKYCAGLDSHFLTDHTVESAYGLLEEHLKRKSCVGVKLYPGYHPVSINDKVYEPVYELARRYQKPVAVHTGLTAGTGALLKYSHPLQLDEAAVRHPGVRFIMCHFGNPWLSDAAAVFSKNQNVAVDLSGLMEGRVELKRVLEEQRGYLGLLKAWLQFCGRYRAVLFGTDWPLVNLEEYIDFIAELIPDKHLEHVFFDNANEIYGIGL